MTNLNSDLRLRIIESAVRLIDKDGLSALSMREVARRAGVSHQAPYHYFADREGILAAVAEEGFRRLNCAILVEQPDRQDNAAARIAEGCRAYVGFAIENPAYFRVMFRPELVRLENYPAAHAEANRAYAILKSIVHVAVQGRVITPELAEGTALVTWAFVQGLAWLLVEGPLSGVSPQAPVKPAESALMAYASLFAEKIGAPSRRR